jgi:plasmid maintenance system antidote protein VapI
MKAHYPQASRIYDGTERVFAAVAIAPGFHIQREADELKLSHAQLASRLNLDVDELAELLSGRKPVTPELAHTLEKNLAGQANVWLALEEKYRDHPKNPHRGGARVGAGRKALGLKNKTVRLAASDDDMSLIESWLKQQDSAAQALAQLVLKQVKQRPRAR